MKETVMEEAVRDILQLINNGGADPVTLEKINGAVDDVYYYGSATYEHASSLEALERCNDAFHQLNGRIDWIGFYKPAEISFKIEKIAFWREVEQWIESIGMREEELDDDQYESLGRTIGELAKALRWKNITSRS